MEFSGIYEPITVTQDPGVDSTIYFRSVTIDIDGVRDAALAAERVMRTVEHVDEVRTTFRLVEARPHQGTSIVPSDKLDDLGAADRNRMQFEVEGLSNNLTIANVYATLVRGQRPHVFSMRFHGFEDASAELRMAIIRAMLDNGRPRVDLYNLLRLALFLPTIALAAATIWLQEGSPSLLPAIVFAWLTVGVVLVATIIYYRHLRQQQGSRSVGVNVIMENREKTASRRADRKRDILSGFIGLVVGVLLALLTFWLTQLGGANDKVPQPASTPGAHAVR